MKWIDTHVHIGRFHNTRYLAGDLAPQERLLKRDDIISEVKG